MAATYPIIEIESESRGAIEQLGSKPKFWFRRDGHDWLFKEARESTGEDWAEKVASTIAERLGVRSHYAELAVCNGRRGCAVKSFVVPHISALVHGNEVLELTVPGYDMTVEYGQSDHTIDNIVGAIERLFPMGKERHVAATRMVGYLVLDALIGNTDRHHQNWGVLLTEVGPSGSFARIEMAPTYDHASSLGRELSDARRNMILREQSVRRYVERARGGIFASPEAKRGMSPLDVARRLALDYPELFFHWQRRLKQLPVRFWDEILACVPDGRMTDSSKLFASALLAENRSIIEELS